MVNYRRARVPGGTYFFTVALADRRSRLLVDHVHALRDAVRRTRDKCPFGIVAMVVLPDHLHAIWTLPAGDVDYSGRWRSIKARFTRAIRAWRELPTPRTAAVPERVWQARFWEHTIRDERDLQAHVDYIHFNPVKHGHVGRARDWPASSFHRYVRAGLLDIDWAGEDPEVDGGEP